MMARQKLYQRLWLLVIVGVAMILVEVNALPQHLTSQQEIFGELVPASDTVASSTEGIAATSDDIDTSVPFRSDTHDLFSWQLLRAVLLEETTKNVIISPFSVKLVLALLTEAAGLNTKTQLQLMSVQADNKSLCNVREFYRRILSSFGMENNSFNTLNFRTKLFTDLFIEPQQRYAARLQYSYNADIQRLNFKDAAGAVTAINDWSSNATNGRLTNLVNEQNIEHSIMLLINVIYFNGYWRRQFTDTFDGVFFKSPEQQVRVKYMEQTDDFYYFDSESMNAKILRLPYKGKKAMFVVLPKKLDGLQQLTHRLGNSGLKSMQRLMEEVKVQVILPKFRFDYSKSLKDTLSNLGIQEIFTNNASLPGLTRGADVAGKVKVSNILQKAGIGVNENGTEAFAATVVEIENRFGGVDIVEEFHVNRPFIFIIEEETTGTILFAGKVHDPSV